MTSNQTQIERERFEEWFTKQEHPNPSLRLCLLGKDKDGRYSSKLVEIVWKAWQGRAAQSEWISVKDRLPEYKNDREQFLIMCQWKREPKTYFYKTSRLLKMLDHIYFDSEPCGADVIYWQPIPRVVELEANHERD